MPFADELARNGLARGRAAARMSVCAGAGVAAAPARRSARRVCPRADARWRRAARCWPACPMPRGRNRARRIWPAVRHRAAPVQAQVPGVLDHARCRRSVDQALLAAMAGAGCAAPDRRRLSSVVPACSPGIVSTVPRRCWPHICRTTCTAGWRISVPATAIWPARWSRAARGSARSICTRPRRVRSSRRGPTWRARSARSRPRGGGGRALARCHARPAASLRRHRQQSAVSPGARRSARAGARLHRQRGRRAGAGGPVCIWWQTGICRTKRCWRHAFGRCATWSTQEGFKVIEATGVKA